MDCKPSNEPSDGSGNQGLGRWEGEGNLEYATLRKRGEDIERKILNTKTRKVYTLKVIL